MLKIRFFNKPEVYKTQNCVPGPANGFTGATGPNGEQGIQGPEGQQGPAGPEGAKGPHGDGASERKQALSPHTAEIDRHQLNTYMHLTAQTCNKT